jgi:hypothetical protein
MMEDELQVLWAHRRAQVDRFIACAEQYKECDQCRAILTKGVGICCFCGTYRFVQDPDRIRATAREMKTRPFPLAAPVMPRSALSSVGSCGMMGEPGKRVELSAKVIQKKSE